MPRILLPQPRGQIVDKTGRFTIEWDATQRRINNATGWVETILTPVAYTELPTTLGRDDAGALVFVSTYHHLLRWDGDMWRFAPGDPGSGFYAAFGAPPTPQTDGWQVCDGTTTTYLIVNSIVVTVGSFTTPVVAGQYFRR